MRIGFQDPFRVRKFHIRYNLKRAFVRFVLRYTFVDHRDFHQLFADFHRRVQRCHRFLVNHGDFVAANVTQFFCGHGVQITAFEFNGSANNATIYAQILHHTQGDRGFPAARFADQANRFARLHRNRKIHHSGDFPQPCEKGNGQIVDF